LLGGLLVLSRLDAAIFVPFLILAPLWQRRKKAPWRALVAPALLAVGVFIVVLLPSILWNWLTFQTLTPISGTAKMRMARLAAERAFGGWTPAFWQRALVTWWESVRLSHAMGLVWWWTRLWPVTYERLEVVLWLLCLIPLLALLRPQKGSDELAAGSRLAGWLLPLWPLALLHLAVFSMLLWSFAEYNNWHYLPEIYLFAMWGALGISLLLDWGAGHFHLPQWVESVTVLLLVSWLAIGQARNIQSRIVAWAGGGNNAYYSGRTPLYESALWARENLPADALLAAWNAGIVGYFSGHQVINLDGVINNHELLRYYEQQRPIVEYLRQKGVRYVIDVTRTGQSDLPGLTTQDGEVIHRIPFRDGNSDQVVFRLGPE